jgi:hypothetical protein
MSYKLMIRLAAQAEAIGYTTGTKRAAKAWATVSPMPWKRA